ncbi:MAG: insulinase family protein, partial [Elusimicrobiota bacterium]
MKMTWKLAVLAVLPVAFAVAQPQEIDYSLLPKIYDSPLKDDLAQVTVHRLPNGLTVYLSPNKETPRVTAWIAVRAGGAQDPDDASGMAHYLEHMLFKGSTRLGTTDYKREYLHLEKIAQFYDQLFKTMSPKNRDKIYKDIDWENEQAARYAVANEFDKTYRTLGIDGVNAFTDNEQTVYICDLPANRLRAWAKVESDRFQNPVFRLFQTEIETVFEEKNRWLDNPERILSDAVDKALYGEHPYGRP